MNGERSEAYRGVRLCRQPGGGAIKGGCCEGKEGGKECSRGVTAPRHVVSVSGTD